MLSHNPKYRADSYPTVLRMLSNYVGEDKFLKGVSIYLKNHLYANSVSNDLWDGISEATGKPVTEMMQTWVGKVCYGPHVGCQLRL